MANNKIKGITVEIGGDTSKLGKALENSEKHTRSLQTELRQVEKLLKFDPTNTELLVQKQTILKDAVSETAKKLKTLEEAEAQVIAQFERGEIAEDQLRAFQREIVQTKNNLKDMKNELTTTEKAIKDVAKGGKDAKEATSNYGEAVKKAKKELEDFKKEASETFETLKTGAGVIAGAITATGGYALKVSTDFDKAFNTLATQTGASASEMDRLNEAMENVYANNFGESIEDVANAMAIVKTNTGFVGNALESVTQNALLMRDTFGFEVNESIRAVNALMNQFGISANEAYNLIAQGAQKGLNQNDDLLDVINEYSVQFENAGYTAEDMFNMLANGVEAGTWSVDKLGDAVKEFNIRMSDGSAKDAVEALGFSWENVSESWSKGGDEAKTVFNMLFNELDGLENTTEGYAIGVGLLGTMYEDLGQDAVLALSQTEGEISKTSDALNKINETKYDDIGSAIQGLGRTLQTDIVDPLGDELKPYVEDMIGYVQANGPEIKELLGDVVESVGDFVGFIVNNGDIILSVITGIGAGMLVWNVASIINSVVGAIKAYQLANEGATIAQALFNAVLNANPLMLIVTLITAVVVALVTFVATNENARNKIKEIWTAITGFFSDAWQSVVNTWNSAKTYFSNLWTALETIFSAVKPYLSSKFSEAWSAVKAVFSGWGTFFGGLWNTIKNKFSTIGTNIANAISSSVRAGLNGVISSIESTINRGIGLINGAIELANKLPGVDVGTIGMLSLPRLARGGIVDSPTFAQIGEDGAEAVIPLENNTEWIKLVARGLSDQLGMSGGNAELLNKLDNIYEKLGRLQVVLDTGILVGETIDKIDAGLATKQSLRARGV